MDEIYGSSRQHESHEHVVQEYRYISHENMRPAAYITESNCSNFSFKDDFSTQEAILDQVDFGHEDNRPYMIRWKSGKRVDPRLLTLLESFRELYANRREFFKKIFPGLYDEFVDVFNKIGLTTQNKQMQSRTLERSLSLGSSRRLQQTEEGSEMRLKKFKVKNPKVIEMRLEKFKVKTPKVIVAGSDSKGGQNDQGVSGSSGSN